MTLRKRDFDIGFVRLRVRMLFHHVGGNRLELKRARSHRFFSCRRVRGRELAPRSSIRASLPTAGGSQKRRVETRTEWERFPNFLTKTIKRCKQRVDGGRWCDDATRRDDISPSANELGLLFVRRWMLIDTARPRREISKLGGENLPSDRKFSNKRRKLRPRETTLGFPPENVNARKILTVCPLITGSSSRTTLLPNY